MHFTILLLKNKQEHENPFKRVPVQGKNISIQRRHDSCNYCIVIRKISLSLSLYCKYILIDVIYKINQNIKYCKCTQSAIYMNFLVFFINILFKYFSYSLVSWLKMLIPGAICWIDALMQLRWNTTEKFTDLCCWENYYQH